MEQPESVSVSQSGDYAEEVTENRWLSGHEDILSPCASANNPNIENGDDDPPTDSCHRRGGSKLNDFSGKEETIINDIFHDMINKGTMIKVKVIRLRLLKCIDGKMMIGNLVLKKYRTR